MDQSNQKSIKRFVSAFAGYLLPTFPLGYVWHLVLFKTDYHALQLYRDEVIIPFGIASMTIQGLLFAWIYPRLFSTRRSDWLQSSVRFFAIFSVLAWSFTTLPVAAKYQMSSIRSFLVLETSFTAIHFLFVSPLIALAYRDPS